MQPKLSKKQNDQLNANEELFSRFEEILTSETDLSQSIEDMPSELIQTLCDIATAIDNETLYAHAQTLQRILHAAAYASASNDCNSDIILDEAEG